MPTVHMIAVEDSETGRRDDLLQDDASQEEKPQEALVQDALTLYHFDGCYWCGLVREAADDLNVPLTFRDIDQDDTYLQQLLEASGRRTVPVLRIRSDDGRIEWLPESTDIIRRLRDIAGHPDPLPRGFDFARMLLRRLPLLLLVAGLVSSGESRMPLIASAAATYLALFIFRRRQRARLRQAVRTVPTTTT